MNYKDILPVATLIKNNFFSDLNTYEHTDELVSIVKKIDSNAFLHTNEYFCFVNPKHNQVEYGWKIHLSSILETAQDLLEDVANYCIHNCIAFKFLKDKNILSMFNSKAWGRASSGKFITIYPNDEDHFKMIIEDLYCLVNKYKGPYILSDKRYKDSKVLFYRYGNIGGLPKIKADGSKEYYIVDPDGRKVIDNTQPYYSIPQWIKDPLLTDFYEQEDLDEGLKENRYIIKEAIDMQNSGGVYRAYDNLTQEYVILKETRPFISIDGSKYDCMYLRKNELEVLRKLKNKEYVPEIIDAFFEWEHFFIVVSEVKGTLLSNYIADLDTGISHRNNLSTIYSSHKKIFLELLKSLKDMHDNNISLGDFSTSNIIVKEDNTIAFIDLELANSGDIDNLAFLQYATRGYRLTRKRKNFQERFLIDKEGLGLTLLSFYTNANNYIKLSEQIFQNTLKDMQTDYKIPIEFIEVIYSLIFNGENSNFNDLIQKIQETSIDDSIEAEIKYKFPKNQLIIELEQVLESTTHSMLRMSQNYWGEHRIFPTHPMENPKSLYFGDLGVLLSLKYVLSNNGAESLVNKYLSNVMTNINQLTPGLFSGLSGVAIGTYLLGNEKDGIDIFKKAIQKNSIFEECLNVKDGITGYGLANIFFYRQLQDEKYKTLAEEIANKLIQKAEIKGDFIYWISDECIEYGFAQGISGIAFFFTELYKITHNTKYLNIAKSIILFLISTSTQEGDCLYFNKNSNKEFFSPYLEGSAGIAKAFVSYLKVDNDMEIKNALKKLLNSYDFKYLKSPSFDYGLAAIGDVLVDLYYLEKHPLCLNRLRKVAEGILNYKIEDGQDVYFPSSISSHISFDYGTGASGIIVFFKKLSKILAENK
ncbi:lanthionine synthetase LanC family protein [Bacillus thuringiensis]|uniref:class III lanthionine synthetase LanKC N-terminal domain-containing protein n=1 Tax=Bacillus thuringiensis TaxID=1428 RepID=UPI000B43E7FD|nr:lanthionine synthetase LanC family protein [Bacillus thuringiensis]MDA2520012.1 protein kinase/lanthionine synthetase C family protein [Bacillus cereus]OTY05517.1 hypothetical protein BK734_23075 [Bacillus thuringiensis serovar kim]OUB13774.1 hypothetical protein BK733_26860 [Bacillus thuringiensis serovar xiaguangiensis]